MQSHLPSVQSEAFVAPSLAVEVPGLQPQPELVYRLLLSRAS